MAKRWLSVFLVGAALLVGMAIGRPSASGSTVSRFTPGYLNLAVGSLFIRVYNPTGSTVHVKSHMVDPTGSYTGGTPDETDAIGAGQVSTAVLWICASGTCTGTPVVTSSSPLVAISVQYPDAPSSQTITVRPGELKRF